MYYINEQITKTFEHLLHLRSKYHSIDTLITSPRKSRILYRINQDKLDKYHSLNNSKSNNEHRISNINKKSNIEEKNLIPLIKLLSDKVIHRKTISTQTTFNKEIDLTHSSLNTLSRTSELDLSTNLSSSLSNTHKMTTNNSNTEFDFSHQSYSHLSIKSSSNQLEEYKFTDYPSKPSKTNSRVYIRSIVRHMLSDDISDS